MMCGFLVVPSEHSAATSQLMNLRGPDRVQSCHYSGFRLQHWLLDINNCVVEQPVVGKNGALVWNGQIYGFLESRWTERASLQAGADDTAALCNLILEEPLSLRTFAMQIDAVEGEFAICVISATGDMFLATDAFGTKPLAVGFTSHGQPIAASYSEDLENLGCVGIRRLPPGTVARISVGGRIEQQSHSAFEFTNFGDVEESVHHFRSELAHSILSRLRTASHEPIVKLSSGVDSGLIALIAMQNHVNASYWMAPVGEDRHVVDLRTSRLRSRRHSVHHVYLSDDEFAKEQMFIARHFRDYRVSASGMRENFPDARIHAIPGYVVGSSILRHARELGHRIELSGQGVDEIFTDYLGGSGLMASTDGSISAFKSEWRNFRHGWNQAFLAASERIAGLHGFETRYPFLSKPLVQAYLNVPIERRMQPEKTLLKELLAESGFSFSRRKVGFLGHVVQPKA